MTRAWPLFVVGTIAIIATPAGNAAPATSRALASAPVFRLHLSNEPATLDPQRQRSSASSYLTQNLHRNFFRFDDEAGLIPDLGEKCRRRGRALTCTLKKDLRWSDGRHLVAEDFLKSYRRLLDPTTQAYRADVLFPIKNARAIYEGKKPASSLGARALDARTLKFEFETADPEFEYALSNLVLAPFRADFTTPETMPTSGPYKIKSWEKGRSIVLTTNAHFPGANPRPDVEFRFVEEDGTALKLYEKGELDFLRRVPAALIPQYEGRKDFLRLPVTRLDYIGFGPRLRGQANVREALALSLDYEELRKVFFSKGRPGCPGVPESWFQDGDVPCHPFDAARARQTLGERKISPVAFDFSALGGDDHKRAAEWEQSQWKKNLGVDVRVRAVENKIFLAELKDAPPDLFRKGVAPDRPTCAALLETFTPDHPENFLGPLDPALLALIKKSREGPTSGERRKSCEAALRWMMEKFLFIPTGRIEFALLAKPTFTGWRLNQMNQLDLGDLQAVPAPTGP